MTGRKNWITLAEEAFQLWQRLAGTPLEGRLRARFLRRARLVSRHYR